MAVGEPPTLNVATMSSVLSERMTADAVYGSDYHFRTTAEGHGLGYVVGVRTDFAAWAGFRQVRVGALLAGIPADSWHRLSCGPGSKGPRVYDWALSRLNSPEPDEYARWVLTRRSVSDPGEVAYGGPPARRPRR